MIKTAYLLSSKFSVHNMKNVVLPLSVIYTVLISSLLSDLSASPVILKRKSDSHQAPVITTNPTDVVYRADFPSFNSPNVVGIVQFYSLNGTTKVHLDLTGLPKNAGVFSYHIHESGIPTSDGMDMSNACESAGLHFNPFDAPLSIESACKLFSNDARCQVGDLSGKHGLINTTCFETYYYDPYISLDPQNPAYIGGKSLVVHFENNTKLACANVLPATEPEDLLLLDPESEAAQISEFNKASCTDKTKVSYFGMEPLQKRANINRFDVYENLDWGLAEIYNDLGDLYGDDEHEDVDKEVMHKDIELAPIIKNTTEYLGNKTSNGTAVNAGNTTTSHINAASPVSNLHLLNCIRILLIGTFMSLF